MARVMTKSVDDHHLQFEDPKGYYVWPGLTGPVRGGYPAFQEAEMGKQVFADADWETAIESAKKDADKLGHVNIYVVRNG
jgi:hypothetical protein